MDATGSNLRLLAYGGDQPDWSPNGNRVAYRASATAGISLVDPNCLPPGSPGCLPTLLPGALPGDRSPAYKPGGAKIAFTRGTHIWVMNADGSGQVQLTDQDDDSPTWSPDGIQIAFSSRRLGCPHSQIWIVNALSGAVVRLLSSSTCLHEDTKPSWR